MKKDTRIPITDFAAPERLPIEIVHRQASAVRDLAIVSDLLGSASSYVFILNQQRQIVFASRSVRDLVPARMRKQLLGVRPGEALGCIHANESKGGCGTSKSCRKCGAVQAILSSLSGHSASQKFHLTRFIGCRQQSLHFQAMATPLTHDHELFSLLVLTRGADAKFRLAMERLFPAEAGSEPTMPKTSAQIRAVKDARRGQAKLGFSRSYREWYQTGVGLFVAYLRSAFSVLASSR